ncbi:FIS1 [Lepeophtheirus salmonis]|uniref:FIS1 n=1 Tax=Lepeophtheirus salmonis TaxID=72036 RepID=A0A7R8HFH0_LEPSM|nr:FIS1 [Lepeophtheirus salmonis]CAF3044359.1 FIS1 [Lepeophtheirus salmonis]
MGRRDMEKILLEDTVSTEDLKKFETRYHEEQAALGTPKISTQFDYAWCLVKSKYPADIRRGIFILEQLYKNEDVSDKKDLLYYLAIGNARIKEYNVALKFIRGLLQVQPDNRQAKELESVIKKKMEREGLVGAALVGGTVLAFGGLEGLRGQIYKFGEKDQTWISRMPGSKRTCCIDDYDCIGFDLDHTLCRYNIGPHGYDPAIRRQTFDHDRDFICKGLPTLDCERGNLLRLGQDGFILAACHGMKKLSDTNIEKKYGRCRRKHVGRDYTSHLVEFGPQNMCAFSPMLHNFMDYFDIAAPLLCARIVEISIS